jgi:site-specific DNA recombinase
MKLIGYARVSSDSQEDNTSLLDQETRIRSYCVAMNHQLIGIHSEVASGASMKRPSLQTLLDYLPIVEGIIVLKLDRLSRSVLDTVGLVAKLC